MAEQHNCPHDGHGHWGKCGVWGWLCHRCREDRADARQNMLTDAMHELRNQIDHSMGWLGQQVGKNG